MSSAAAPPPEFAPLPVEAACKEIMARADHLRGVIEQRVKEWKPKIEGHGPILCSDGHPPQPVAINVIQSALASGAAGVLKIVPHPCPVCEARKTLYQAERRLLDRGVPARCLGMTLDTWQTDWERTHATRRANVLAKVTDWVTTRPHPFLIILGFEGGTGKTALGVAALRALGGVWRVLEFRDWISQLLSMDREEREFALKRVRTYPALMIDDFGNRYVGEKDNDGGNAFERDVLGTVLNYRHDKALPTVITSNLDRQAIAFRLDTRSVDRLKGGALVIDMTGWPSKRAAEASQ